MTDSDGAGERLAVLRLGQRRVGAPHLGDPTQADAAVVDRPKQAVSPVANESREDHGHHVLAPRQRHEPEHPVHLSSQATTVDEDETFASLRMLVGELHGHPATEGLADDGGPVDVEDLEQITDPAGECTE